MRSVYMWFVIPAQGRVARTSMCLRALRRTIEDLPFDASAVVVATDGNLASATEVGFSVIDTQWELPLGAKWNHAIEFAADQGATHVVPLGSDNWVHPQWLRNVTPDAVLCARNWSMVNEAGSLIAPMRMNHDGGSGIRAIPTRLLEPLNYRPCIEDKGRSVDTSTWARIRRHWGTIPVEFHEVCPEQIVDFKGPEEQINSFARAQVWQIDHESDDVWERLGRWYPPRSILEAQAYYDGLLTEVEGAA